MAKKACIIVAWFGPLPEFFGFWERSCGCNEAYVDFLLVTDQDYAPAYPNIHVQRCTLEELRQKCQRKLAMEVSLEKAFKTCDFRPAYGVIFHEELAGYDYWGHCDLDQVFGDLGRLFDRPDFGSFDKIGRSGHLTLYRNCQEVNELFRREGALYGYEDVFASSSNYAFDERTGICRIAQKNGTAYLNIVDLRADLWVQSRRLEIHAAKNYEKQLFYWENGRLYRAFLDNGQIRQEEYIYIHFQKKKLKNFCASVPDAFYIGREGFFEKTGAVTPADFDRYNSADAVLARYWNRGTYLFKKLGDYFRSTKEQKAVWRAQKKIGNEHYD